MAGGKSKGTVVGRTKPVTLTKKKKNFPWGDQKKKWNELLGSQGTIKEKWGGNYEQTEKTPTQRKTSNRKKEV